MSNSFNENLAAFLISCRESAVQELAKNNPEYKQLQSSATEISNKVKDEIPHEYEALIDNLTDAMYALARMEANYLYLRGFRDWVNLYKTLDNAYIESTDFERYFI